MNKDEEWETEVKLPDIMFGSVRLKRVYREAKPIDLGNGWRIEMTNETWNMPDPDE